MSRPLRYTFILVLVALSTTLAAVGGWRYARASAPVPGPIILISIDTLRADHLPAYGYGKVRTPALDALARDGVVFERAYSHAPQTLPAHAALLSGRLPFETGVRDNFGFALKNGERLLPQMLHDRGYATAGIVSAYVLRKATGVGQGFDFFDAKMPELSPDVAAAQVQRDGAESEKIAERWLQNVGSTRVFLFLHLYEPHTPYEAPDRFAEYAPYDAEIAYADEIVGRLIHFLKTHQLYDQSTIVLLSDHGEGLGDHGEQEHGLLLYDEALRVPLLIKQAGGVGAGRRVTDVVQHLDIVPTILDLAKAPVPGGLRGRSLTPLLEGTGQLPERAVYSEALYGRYHFGWSELTALTEGRYRYIKAPDEELYDLQRDPDERQNIAGERGQAAQAMRGALDRMAGGAKLQPPAAVSADARERLRALGYVGSQLDAESPNGGVRADPKDKLEVLEHYRTAVNLANEKKWMEAIAELQKILRTEPAIADVWDELAALATRIDRHDVALDAYKHVIELRPADPNGLLGAANALLKLRRLDDARAHAELAATLAERDARTREIAQQLLANIALLRHDADAARREADLALQIDPASPAAAYVEARLLYDQGKYEEALPHFEEAIAQVALSHDDRRPMPDLHYYLADALGRLDRYSEAEWQFAQELRHFPHNIRARVALATLYQSTGRTDEAAETVADMIRITPTPESYALATRLMTTFGNRQEAEAVRAEARRLFAEATRPAHH